MKPIMLSEFIKCLQAFHAQHGDTLVGLFGPDGEVWPFSQSDATPVLETSYYDEEGDSYVDGNIAVLEIDQARPLVQ